MAPSTSRRSSPVADAAPSTARLSSPADDAPPSEGTLRDILFMYKGGMDVIKANPAHIGVRLRVQIARQLKVKDPTTLRLLVLRRDDGTWADQDDALTVDARELRYPLPIGPILPSADGKDMVHLRVELAPPTKDDKDKEKPLYDSDGEVVSCDEESNGAFNVMLQGSTKKRKASGTFALSDCDKNTTDSIFKFKRVGTYTEEPVDLPDKYMTQLREAYRTKMRSWVNWADGIEEERRAFINAVLEYCIAPLNDQLWERVKGDEDLYHKQRMTLCASVDLKSEGMDGVGKADYVIQRGNRMVVVIEAKRCDMTKAKHQNFAVMEAARCVNKGKDRNYRSIKGICTDFQSWVFVSRDKRSILTDSTSMVLTNGIEVPPNFETIVNKVYGMLVRL